MKRLPFAAVFALALLTLARADEGAYKNLVGMARAASADRGPDADDAPSRAPAAVAAGAEQLKDSVADVPAPRAAAPKAALAPSGSARAPAAAQPKLWTRLYSTLMPSWRPAYALRSGFDSAVSTAPARAPRTPLPALMPPPDSEAVSAGERRGLAELMSVSAPTAQ